MDSGAGKSGQAFLQPQKSGRKWKPVWLTLVPPSSSGIGRLEIQTLGGTTGEHGLRRPQALGERKPKVVRLSELLNVLRLPPNAEACPMENMCAFCVETQDRTLVFAALKDDCAEWVDRLCQNTFQKSSVPVIKPQMEENAIYASADEDFRVTLQKTDAAARCGLQGTYWLKVDREALLLKDTLMITVQEWPYELLRRYGKDKVSLSIETGRRCDCGPGTFIFETSQAETIFTLIQSTIKRKTTHMAPPGGHALEVDKSITPNRQTHSPLPRMLEVNNKSAIFENKLKVDNEEAAPSQPAPITLMPLPSLPTQETKPKTVIDNVYADLNECMQSPMVSKALYVDPASILPIKPPGNAEPNQTELHSVYSEVFDKVGVVQSVGRFRDDDHIYSEPVKRAENKEEKEKEVQKADPFAHLYSQVCKTKKRSTSPQPRVEEKEREEKEREEKEREVEKKADPFVHLYAQVCKTNKRSTSPQPRVEEKEKEEREREEKEREEKEREEKEREEKEKEEREREEKEREEKERDNDVIYENLGII
ncbi:docking protein 1-like isoform X2 [Eucyclogobius newberryi]|uniref:docking protein 1-like isoform X2 n=1 Tax=Eucyclogobius newberryi TaxID=166745 RepID=UPI003B5BD3D7